MKKPLFNFVALSFCVGSFCFWELEGPFGQKLVDGQLVDKRTSLLLSPIEYIDVNLQEYEIYNKVYSEAYSESYDRVYMQLQEPYPINRASIHAAADFNANKGGQLEASKVSNFIINSNNYICMYNKQTGYSIGYINIHDNFNYHRVAKFFLGGSKTCLKSERYEISHSRISDFYFVKERSGVDLTGSTDPIFGTQLYLKKLIELNGPNYDDNIKINEINIFGAENSWQRLLPISDEINSKSRIVITNKEKDKIEITQSKESGCMELESMKAKEENAPLDFQVQLVKYFDKDSKNREFAENLGNSLQTDEGLSVRKLNALKFASRVGEGEIKRLNNSNIIAVYGLVENDRGQDAIIWGLAEDKKSHRRFHWVTDLEDDISALLRQ